MSREDAVDRVLATLGFFLASPQGSEPDVTGFKGFYYHLLDLHSGLRVWQCELSLIDTTLLLAGVLTAARYFDGLDAGEREIQRLAEAFYQRID